MYSVESSKSKPEYLELLREWCLVEWSKIDSFDVSDKGIEIPAPLVALLDRELIGGLAFTSYPIPGDTCLGLWINAVIVAPDHRGKGVASRLISAAEAEANRLGATSLFAYSSVVGLYQKRGWIELSRDGSVSVLQKVLSN